MIKQIEKVIADLEEMANKATLRSKTAQPVSQLLMEGQAEGIKLAIAKVKELLPK